MASITNLGGVFTTDIDNQLKSLVFLSTENVVGLIFDTAIVGGLTKALGTGTKAAETFANGNVVELNSIKDLEDVGLDSEVLAGVAEYHVKTFFSLAGNGQRLFISFMDSDDDDDFAAVEKMQLASNGIIYQIGVWTGKPIATKSTEGNYVVSSDGILTRLESQAELLGGTIGVKNFEGNSPLNIILNAPVIAEAVTDHTKLPDINVLSLPKVSYILGQPATEETHQLMYKVNHANTDPEKKGYAVVGNIGAALACLALAPSNESIAHVESFNLQKAIREAEFGFGNLEDDAEKGTYKAVSSFTNVKTLGYLKRNAIHQKGYIFLTFYDGLEESIFFSSDQTLTSGDYRTIARCRVMHKSRRVVRRALLPRVNSNVEIDVTTGKLSASTVSEFQNIVLQALDANMVEPGTTKPQISGRTCSIDENQDVLSNDKIMIDYRLIPLGCASEIDVTEGFAATE